MRGYVQLVLVLQAFMSAPHLATPTNFFLHLAFSGPLSSPHAYATRAGPTLDWPLSSYKPGSPRALTCSPLRACQSCLPGAQLIRVAPISHLLCGLLALSSASLHRLVSQSTRNMIDWLGFLLPCAFLYTTNSQVACGVRVCKLTSSYPFHSPHACATRACSTPGQPLSSYKPCTPRVLLCSPHRTRQSCLSDAWCIFLLPSRAYAIRVYPTLGCSSMYAVYNIPFKHSCLRHTLRPPQTSSLA